MHIDEVIGYFTYRSFRDQPVGTPDELLWGEGELFLLISDGRYSKWHPSFRKRPASPENTVRIFHGT